MDKKPLSRSTQQQKKHPPKWAVKAAKKLKKEVYKRGLRQKTADHLRDIKGDKWADSHKVPPRSPSSKKPKKDRWLGVTHHLTK